jgi:hypothetical protein
MQQAGKKIGEVKVKKYLVKNDSTLLRLEEATVRVCTVPDDEAKSRECTELGKAEGRECEELLLVYRPSGCIREKNKIDLNEMATVKAESLKELPNKMSKNRIEKVL